ncbi:short-chain dehydrogenase [Steroidobacter denitrificans]|uniref:Short-chain dehydrogenase n=1 Tax=Steroidobacter denitrificans TaxID=465721 RepID=A0A127FBG3_STEDE|nr:SDR family oxidoreductase [Steroidobacter denitrificans]AMN46940.1 short-chain dehydrogenase [Steroidobacter denitrificans]
MKRVMIVGATSAIAAACARRWAAQGCEFFLVARNAEKLERIAHDLRVRGVGEVTLHTMDATDLKAHPTMLKRCIDTMQRIDVALVAYGTLPDQYACERDVSTAVQEFNNNGVSVIALLSLLANRFEAQAHGTLAVISSVAGDRGRPSNYLYGAAKAAVSAFCEGLRGRLFRVGAHVITIKPGFVDSPMTAGLKLPRLLVATPDQVARRIVSAIERRVCTQYTPGYWALIILIIKSIPQPIFKRLKL